MAISEQQAFKQFKELFDERPDKVIFFTGAGLSTPLFPTWKELLKEMIEVANDKKQFAFDKSILIEKIENGLSYLDIADFCATEMGANEYRDFIEKNFDKQFSFEEIPEAYRLLMALPFKGVITTNYDRIPEVASNGNFNSYTNKNISEALRALIRDKKIILKLHGDIVDQSSIVLTQSDFKKIVNNQQVRSALSSLLSTSTICFIGFSLSDPHLELILDFLNSINNGQNITHYALLTTTNEFDIMKVEKRYGIRAIKYNPIDNHREVLDFINLLNHTVNIHHDETPISSEEDLIALLSERLKTSVGIQSFFIEYSSDSKLVTLNYFTRANSEYEIQREIVSIFRSVDIPTDLIEEVCLCTFAQTTNNKEYVRFCPIVLMCRTAFVNVISFIKHELTESLFWKKIDFYQPYFIGTIHCNNHKVEVPHLNI